MGKNKVFGQQKIANNAATVRNYQGKYISGNIVIEYFYAVIDKIIVVNEVIN